MNSIFPYANTDIEKFDGIFKVDISFKYRLTIDIGGIFLERLFVFNLVAALYHKVIDDVIAKLIHVLNYNRNAKNFKQKLINLLIKLGLPSRI